MSANQTSESVWPLVEPFLLEVERPSRYIGSEWGAAQPKDDAEIRFALAYPDTYEVGQPNQGISILYNILNNTAGVSCERTYVPWPDMAKILRQQHIPLFTLESYRSVKSFDVFGITFPHELAATNIIELLDLAKIPIWAADRQEDDPIVIAGGPSIFNPEPIAPFFDACSIGAGEEAIVEIAHHIKDLKLSGVKRSEIVASLAEIDGIYVPSLYDATYDENDVQVLKVREGLEAPLPIRKRVVRDLSATPAISTKIVPYMDVVHDRLSIEVLRGCARGCRFCQAGMTYRPVRERSQDEIVAAVNQGLACTGFDEISLMSLSTTDYSEIAPLLNRLNRMLEDTGQNISIPSQRLDSFGVEMAHNIAGAKRGGLTFAPEAGSQRLRDVINKNVTEENLLTAARVAFESGWRRLKLYFMMGLPTETDEDIVAIAELTKTVLEVAREVIPGKERGGLVIGVSVAVFVPKAVTPFQWEAQLDAQEVERRQELLRRVMPKKNVELRYHDSQPSRLEGALSKGDRRLAQVIYQAWQDGAIFDAWSDQFKPQVWEEAAQKHGLNLDNLAQTSFTPGKALPWSHIDSGVSERFLIHELKKAHEAKTTPDCTFVGCTGCRVCQNLGVDNILAGERHGK